MEPWQGASRQRTWLCSLLATSPAHWHFFIIFSWSKYLLVPVYNAFLHVISFLYLSLNILEPYLFFTTLSDSAESNVLIFMLNLYPFSKAYELTSISVNIAYKGPGCPQTAFWRSSACLFSRLENDNGRKPREATAVQVCTLLEERERSGELYQESESEWVPIQNTDIQVQLGTWVKSSIESRSYRTSIEWGGSDTQQVAGSARGGWTGRILKKYLDCIKKYKIEDRKQ